MAAPKLPLVFTVMALAVLVSSILLFYKPGSGEGTATPTAPTVYIVSCSTREVVDTVREASSLLGLGLKTVESSAKLPPGSLLVIDYAGCIGELEAVARMAALVLKSNGTVIVIGSPSEVSKLVKSQRELSLFFPLPQASERIAYMMRVSDIMETKDYGPVATVDASYDTPSVEGLERLLKLAYTAWMRQP